ncbi:hypothetical protein GPLA_2370 [Paraglaciecola polaris LMG 21857]|uniref:Uncharacterized protein n=1 Tax=Paraglaciecola polaris LMG 21857 TaxID=1129793 RepID=K7AD74_9ALTE|nr:hypothetical protein GPLA_2370 [Paraglaciecola polaris LMG 21857]
MLKKTPLFKENVNDLVNNPKKIDYMIKLRQFMFSGKLPTA